jgi:hypothetical protein
MQPFPPPMADDEKMALILSTCEQIALQRKNNEPARVLWQTSEVLRGHFGRKKLAWAPGDVARIAEIAASLGASYYFLPMPQIVAVLERRETMTPAVRRSIKTIAKHMLNMEEAAEHWRLAKRLIAASTRR